MNTITAKERAALEVLRSTGADVLEAALVAKEALEAGRGRTKRAKRCIAEGAEALRKQERTVTFAKAVEAAVEERLKKNRRARTMSDFRYVTRRFMKRCPGLAARRVRSITAQECAGYIETAFDTPRQQQKGRLVLSGIFGSAMKRGWCGENPVATVEAPQVTERPVAILNEEEIEILNTTAREYRGGICAAAVGMMLYAGIRPHEVARLTWKEVLLQERAILIQPRHSKTGGARRVTIHTPLLRILQAHRQAESVRICPPNWQYHWRTLRREAGWDTRTHPWQQDILRHTFASYHLSRFRSYPELQLEMGHRDCSLLRTRYVSMQTIRQETAFWQGSLKK